jgi:hypothetical protein
MGKTGGRLTVHSLLTNVARPSGPPVVLLTSIFGAENIFGFSVFVKKEQDPPRDGSVSQRYGTEDPDPYQNVTDP